MDLLLLTGIVLVGLAILAAAGAAYQGVSERRDRRKYPPPGRIVDIGGHRLHVHCQGEGSPTVVMDSGGGSSSLDWSLVQPGVAEFTKTCSYDRAGHGWSDPGPRPRTSQQIVNELDALLVKADIEGPYVLVGQSFGGMNVRLYASQHPHKVVGMVLVDSTHEAWGEIRLKGPLKDRLIEELRMRVFHLNPILARLGILRLRRRPNGAVDGLPPEIRPKAMALGLQSRAYDWVIGLGSASPESEAQLRSAPPLPDIPLAVLSAHVTNRPWGVPADQADEFKMALQADLASRVPNSTHTVSARGGHNLHIDDPELVIDSIRQVVEAARQLSG